MAFRASNGRILPKESFWMTEAELLIIIEEGLNIREEELVRHADLKTSILNGPHFSLKSGDQYKIQQFLPDEINKKITQEITAKTQADIIKRKGEALAAKARAAQRRKTKSEKQAFNGTIEK